MKKLLLSLVCLLVIFATKAITLDMSVIGEQIVSEDGYSADGITITVAKNNGSTNPAYNTNGKDVRVYAKGTLTITSEVELTKVVFNISTQGLKRLAPITASVGEIAAQAADDETVVWTGNAKEVTFTVGDNAEYGSEGAKKAGQLDFTSIVINEDGEEPEPEPEVAEYEYLSSLTALADKTPFKFTSDLCVYYVSGAYNYVYLPSKWGFTEYALIYKGGLNLEAGQVIKGGWEGEIKIFNKLVELVPTSTIEVVEGKTCEEPQFEAINVYNIATVLENAEYQNAPFAFSDFEIKTIDDKTFTGEAEAENWSEEAQDFVTQKCTVTLYNQFNLDLSAVEVGKVYDVKAFRSQYKDNVQFAIVSMAEVDPNAVKKTDLICYSEGYPVEEISEVYVFTNDFSLCVINTECESEPTIMSATGGELEGVELTWEVVGDMVTFSVEPAITTPGKYFLTIPEGWLKIGDKAINNEYVINLIVEAPAAGDVELTLTPAPGSYEVFPEITIEAPGIEDATVSGKEITITDANGKVVYTITAEELNIGATDWETWAFLGYKLKPEITKPGVYTVNIPDRFFEFWDMSKSAALKAEYTITAPSGIEGVSVNAGVAKYFDLQGREIKNPAAGSVVIRVLNGKATKVFVK